MEKLDLTKVYKSYFTAKAVPELVTIAPAGFVSICGKGDPSGKDFAARIEALYTIAYTIKFYFKAQGQDFTVSKLEGLWWYDEAKYPGKKIATASTDVPRNEWEYRLLIQLPEYVQQQHVTAAIVKVLQQKKTALATAVEYFHMDEGECVQLLHTGPFDTEPVSLLLIADYMAMHQLHRNGLHHEIYLSDFRKTAPDKLKTILREPVKNC